MRKTAFPCFFFWIKSHFYSKQGFLGLFSMVIYASRILPTYQSPCELLGLIANLPYYVFKCTLIFEF